MKIISKEVKEGTNEDGTKTNILDLRYTHKRKNGRILVKDYDDSTYEYVLKQVKQEVTKQYNLTKTLGPSRPI